MTDFLQVGTLVVPVQTTSASRGTSDLLGSVRRAFAGNLLSTLRGEKRQWKFATPPLPGSDFDDLEAAIAAASGFLDCTGEALRGATVRCFVQITDVTFIENDPDVEHLVTLVLREA